MIKSPNRKFGDGQYLGVEKPLLVVRSQSNQSYPSDSQRLSIVFHEAPYRYYGTGSFVSLVADSRERSNDFNYTIISPEFDLETFHKTRVLGEAKDDKFGREPLTDLYYYELDLSHLQIGRLFRTASPEKSWGNEHKQYVHLVKRFGFKRLAEQPEFMNVNFREPLLRYLKEDGPKSSLRKFFILADQKSQDKRETLYPNTELESRLYARVTPIDPLSREYVGETQPMRLLTLVKRYDGDRFR
jgi:hypothetical protein